MNTADHDHDVVRNALLSGDAMSGDAIAGEELEGHLDACPSCAALAERVSTIRRVAPTLAPRTSDSMSRDIADSVMAKIAAGPRAMGGGRPPGRARRFAHLAASRVAIAALVLAVLAVAVPAVTGPDGGDTDLPTADLSDALLVSAQRTEDTGSARLHLSGSAQVRVDGRTIDVDFGGVGAISDSRLRYRGVTKVGDVMIPCELTVIGREAWMRKPDGTWLVIDEPVGALAPVVLDAGSILELLRLPKVDVRLLDETAEARTVAFDVEGRPGLVYDVVAVVGRDDDLLRSVEIRAVTEDWTTAATMTLYGFGEPVTIRPPAASDVVGVWAESPTATMPVRALYPVG